MSLIDFFGMVIKPFRFKGTGTLNPTNTGTINDKLFAIRQLDVNIWIYRKDDHTIAFDSGYKNFPNVDTELEKISLKRQDIDAVFLTHGDMDHGGGIDDDSTKLFPKAKLYFSEDEIPLLSGQAGRFKKGLLSLKNPIRRDRDYLTLRDHQIIHIGSIKVEMIKTPGHTPGHCCYLVDDTVLITGDCMAINANGGYCFFDFFNMNTLENLESLKKLKDFAKDKVISCICTGHSGYCENAELAFANIDRLAWIDKRNPFDEKAPHDVFK